MSQPQLPEHPPDSGLVARLLAAQHPDLAAMALRWTARGWDNDLFRLGPDLAVRLPRHAAAVPLLRTELDWLPSLAPRLSLPVPVALRRGEPGCGYPWPWAIVPWLPGRSALLSPPTPVEAAAEAMGVFLRGLHTPAPPQAPRNPVRGVPLHHRLDRLGRQLAQLRAQGRWDLPFADITAAVEACAQAPGWAGPPVWIHGDPHAHNILVDAGRISAVVDFGDLAGGDPATDLGQLHSLLPPSVMNNLAAAYGVPLGDALWLRAAGWSICLGIAVLAGPDESIRRMGTRLLGRGMAHARARS